LLNCLGVDDRPGSDLHPLRGQNNVQGVSDMGLIHMVYPDYEPVDNPAKFEKLWGVKLNPKRGLTTVEMLHAILYHEVFGMFIEGENPAMSDPNQNHARVAMAALEHLVVQDIFLTETAGFADVILPASAFYEKTGTFSNTDDRYRWDGKPSIRLVMPGNICGLSRKLLTAWVAVGITTAQKMCSMKCG
jgi:formate dehydrogenase major subunit